VRGFKSLQGRSQGIQNLKERSNTIEIRWHGRGGQGAVTSAELLALAAIEEGKFAQAFPSFGPERRGAPVLVFNRLSNTDPIRARVSVTNPDIVVILDPGLLYITDATSGLKENGTLVINSPKTIVDIKSEIGGPWKLAVVNANVIARELLGVPIVNTTMLGALVKATGIIGLESLAEPIKERFGARAKANIDACRRAFDQTEIAESGVIVQKPRQAMAAEVLPTWRELLPGCVITEPGNAKAYRTGDWKSAHPVWKNEKCIKCGICYLFCPEGCIREKEDGYFEADLYYCKGCGICARECWTEAISMVEEE
jgi:pyruvate ferredoxin oxidoreductase gamma subunit